MGVCNCSMFCCTLLYVHFSIAIILMGKRELIALLNLSSWCLVMVERLFFAVPRGCLQFVIVVFPDHTHLLFFCLCIQPHSPLLKVCSCLSAWNYVPYVFVSLFLKKLVRMIRNYSNHKLRQTCGIVMKSHTTIMRHQKDKQSKATCSLFTIKMSTQLEWTQSNAQQNTK